tara:strand:- start:44 stop:802 length:759 start_codon:yes stop_codon:yes gene_type:complete
MAYKTTPVKMESTLPSFDGGYGEQIITPSDMPMMDVPQVSFNIPKSEKKKDPLPPGPEVEPVNELKTQPIDVQPVSSFSLPTQDEYDSLIQKPKNDIGSATKMMGNQMSPQGTVPQDLALDSMTYQPPMPGNVQGTSRPLFNQGATNAAQQIYGSEEQRQQSVPGAPLYMHRGTPHKRDDGKGWNSSGKIPDFRAAIPPRNDGDDASLFGGLKRLTGVDNYVNSRYPTNQPYVAPKIPTNTSVLERFKTNKK